MERVNIQVAPIFPSLPAPPIAAVWPSAERETLVPCCCAAPTPSVPTNLLPSCIHPTETKRIKIQAAPALALSKWPPTRAVLPLADSATDLPNQGLPTPSEGTNFVPSCAHVVPERLKIHTAPLPPSSITPPTIAVLPSAESATEKPCQALPVFPVPINLACCDHVSPVRIYTQVAPMPLLSK